MAFKAAQWPAALLPRKVEFQPETQSRSGGLSLTGSEQVTVSNAGRWRAKVTVSIRGEASNLALRAFVAGMEGRAGTVVVPKWEHYRPRDLNGREFSQVHAASYDGREFNFDLSGFGQSDDVVHAQLAVPAALGATRLSVIVNDGDGPRPGHYVGFDDRLYRVSQAWEVVEGGPLQLQVWPRLRAPAVMAAKVILDKPVCLMRFADDSTGEQALSHAGSGRATFDFVEAI
jgi:hypothetical protein